MNRRFILWMLAMTAAVILLQPLPAAAVENPSVYKANCAQCHGSDGTGSAVGKALHVPDLRSAAVQAKSNAALAHFISEGHAPMPAFKYSLTPKQIMDAVHTVRTLAKHKRT